MRNPAKATHLNKLGVELVTGDLNSESALLALLDNAQALVHGAGAVRGNSQQDFDSVNVAGTATLLRAVRDHAADLRMVHLSSIVAREPELSFYSRSKRRGEDLLRLQPDLNWVALRPPAVYGPGDREMLPIFKTMKRGFATLPGSPQARTSLIHVSDLTDAIIACLDTDAARGTAARGEIFELGDPVDGGYSWAELAAIGAKVFGRPVRLWQVPGRLLDSVAAANSALARLTGAAPMLTPPKLRELRHPDWVADNGPIQASTDWRPQIAFEQGLAALAL